MLDTYKHKGLRLKLIEEIKSMGVQDKKVLDAINAIPRHYYLDKVFEKQAYENVAFQIGAGQTISQPYTVAFQTELLDVTKGTSVLEIGTGSGYQTAVLCELGCKVYSIERQRELFMNAKKLFKQLGYTPKQKYGDGYEGWEAFMPFDRVLVTCGALDTPKNLVHQLKPGGRMVIPIGSDSNQTMRLITKDQNGNISEEEHGDFKFVPMLKDKAR